MLRKLIRNGVLTVTYPDGRILVYQGDGGPRVAFVMTDPSLPRRIVLNPELAVGEGYMDSALTVEGDDLRGFVTLFTRNWELGDRCALMTLDELRRSLMRRIT